MISLFRNFRLTLRSTCHQYQHRSPVHFHHFSIKNVTENLLHWDLSSIASSPA